MAELYWCYDINMYEAMVTKRSTVRLDDDLMTELKARAHAENVSLTRMLNRVVRQGLMPASGRANTRLDFAEGAVAMGQARVELDKALALAAGLEDEEIIRKLSLRK